MEKKIKIEIDVDGVLADLLNNAELKKMLSDVYPDYTEDCIEEYDFANIKRSNPIAAQIIRDSFSNASYMRTVPVYDGVTEGFNRLAQLSNLDICIHTLVFGGYDVIKARKDWLEELEHSANVRYQIDHTKKIMFNDSHIVIEDSPGNLDNSNAAIKILIAHGYNKKYAEEHPEIFVADDFNHATKIIASLIQ